MLVVLLFETQNSQFKCKTVKMDGDIHRVTKMRHIL